MDKTSLSSEANEIKDNVVNETPFPYADKNMFQVWQPKTKLWVDLTEPLFCGIESESSSARRLQFPRDYSFVAFVMTSSLEQVFRCMNQADLEECSFKDLVPVSDEMRSCSVGDVIIPFNDAPHVVAPFGFVSLETDSDE